MSNYSSSRNLANGQQDGARQRDRKWAEMGFTKSMTFGEEELRGAAIAATSLSAGQTTESEFIERLKSRDAAAFETLVERYSGVIYSLLYRLTENPEEAADLTQETFLSAVRSIRKFRGDAEIKTWLIRIAINESRNRYRWWKRRRRDQTISLDATLGSSEMIVSDTIADPGMSPEDVAIWRQRQTALQVALLDLPVVYREAIVLCDIEGLTYEETAKALGVGMGTVKSRISRGREELRQLLKDF